MSVVGGVGGVAQRGKAYDERNVQGLVVERACLVVKPVGAGVFAMVGGENDNGVVIEGRLRETGGAADICAQHLAHLIVDAGLQPGIVVQECFPGLRRGIGVVSRVV